MGVHSIRRNRGLVHRPDETGDRVPRSRPSLCLDRRHRGVLWMGLARHCHNGCTVLCDQRARLLVRLETMGPQNISGFGGMTASVAGIWFVLAWLVPGCARLLGMPDFHLYTSTGFFEDVRFYLGWALGLAVAPNPVPSGANAAIPPEAGDG